MVLQAIATFVWNSPAHFVFRPQEECGSVCWKMCLLEDVFQRQMAAKDTVCSHKGRAAFVQERGCTEGQLAVSGDFSSSRDAQPGEPDRMLGWQWDTKGTQQEPFSWFGRCLQHAGPSLVPKQDQPNADWCMAVTGSECCKKGLTGKHTHGRHPPSASVSKTLPWHQEPEWAIHPQGQAKWTETDFLNSNAMWEWRLHVVSRGNRATLLQQPVTVDSPDEPIPLQPSQALRPVKYKQFKLIF